MSALAVAEIHAYLAEGRRLVDDALEKSLPPLGTPPAALHEAMRYTLLLPGKRLRGIVVLAASDLLRGDPDGALPLAVAVELVHAASLILDDLPSMDNATLRRGKPTLHKVAGEANAILASVGLLTAARAVSSARRPRPILGHGPASGSVVAPGNGSPAVDASRGRSDPRKPTLGR